MSKWQQFLRWLKGLFVPVPSSPAPTTGVQSGPLQDSSGPIAGSGQQGLPDTGNDNPGLRAYLGKGDGGNMTPAQIAALPKDYDTHRNRDFLVVPDGGGDFVWVEPGTRGLTISGVTAGHQLLVSTTADGRQPITAYLFSPSGALELKINAPAGDDSKTITVKESGTYNLTVINPGPGVASVRYIKY